eukprot:6819585-Prymnesium_polylepis.1
MCPSAHICPMCGATARVRVYYSPKRFPIYKDASQKWDRFSLAFHRCSIRLLYVPSSATAPPSEWPEPRWPQTSSACGARRATRRRNPRGPRCPWPRRPQPPRRPKPSGAALQRGEVGAAAVRALAQAEEDEARRRRHHNSSRKLSTALTRGDRLCAERGRAGSRGSIRRWLVVVYVLEADGGLCMHTYEGYGEEKKKKKRLPNARSVRVVQCPRFTNTVLER